MSIEITREELYAQVWARPMTSVASDFGISDVALKKICVKHRVPVPGRGYWAKKAAGQKVGKTILRKLSDPVLNRVTIRGGPAARVASEVIETRKRAHEQERQPENKVEVTEVLEDLHPLVERTRKKLERTKPTENGLVSIKGAGLFDVSVAPASVARVVAFLNAFVFAAEARGYRLERGDKVVHLIVDDEILPFRIAEATNRVRHEPTEKEISTLERWEKRQARRGVDWRLHDWYSKPSIPEWDSVPSGYLTVRIDENHYDGLRRTFADGKKQKIETLINPILAGLATCAAAEKVRREERERQRRKWEEEQRRAEEARRVRALEEKRVEAFAKDLEFWQQRQRVLDFIAVVERRLESADPEEQTAAQEWLDWAHGYAERLDPLGKRLPVLLGENDFEPWQLH